jgi:hypothetical protein
LRGLPQAATCLPRVQRAFGKQALIDNDTMRLPKRARGCVTLSRRPISQSRTSQNSPAFVIRHFSQSGQQVAPELGDAGA